MPIVSAAIGSLPCRQGRECNAASIKALPRPANTDGWGLRMLFRLFLLMAALRYSKKNGAE
jgi:hypothetical protein